MQIQWSGKALSDLGQHRENLAKLSPEAAKRAGARLFAAAQRLISMPRLGEQLYQYVPREVRRLLVDQFEIQYEIIGPTIHILRIWHTRQRR
jgi:plasmid stabilization system protein ParE